MLQRAMDLLERYKRPEQLAARRLVKAATHRVRSHQPKLPAHKRERAKRVGPFFERWIPVLRQDALRALLTKKKEKTALFFLEHLKCSVRGCSCQGYHLRLTVL
jgi:hypothetical protein